VELMRVGVSACLLGQEVRYDGGHKRHPVLIDVLGPRVEWVPVCPEVEIGLGTPREPMKLVRDGASRRLIAIESGTDHTAAMNQWAEKRLDELANADLDGYVVKSKSPSCGIEGVSGPGVFAAALMKRLPLLPIEEERGLTDANLCLKFIERMAAYRRLRRLSLRQARQGSV
jgi:uncharacterized protein YbbK (DUF523 family)